jgi:DNA-binding GntR family transcriptional regulator
MHPLPSPAVRALSQFAARAMREAILAGRYRPGDRLVERELAAAMEISRAPVREGLWLLAKEGLVTLVPHRGAIVTEISPDLVTDAFSVRALLESLAAKLGSTRLGPPEIARLRQSIADMELAGRAGNATLLVEQDIEFHRTLTGACGRPVLLEALGSVWSKTYLLISASRTAYPLERIAALHAPIVDAVVSRDPDRVETAVREHLAFGERTLLDHLRGGSPKAPSSTEGR